MYQPIQQCPQCGAGLSLDDLRHDGCPYCHTVYPHRSMAVQHQHVVGQMLSTMAAQQAQLQQQWQRSMGMPPTPPGVYGDPHALARAQMAQVQRVSRQITMWVVGSTIAVIVVVAVSLLLVL